METCPDNCDGDCDYCDVFLEETDDDSQLEMDFEDGNGENTKP